MKSNKKVLLLGGSGALGSYLIPNLLKMGYKVHVVSLDELTSYNPNLTYEKNDVKNDNWLKAALTERYDAIVDFMIYATNEFKTRYDLLMSSTNHYVFLSSYRVYADTNGPITESSPRLLDVVKDDQDFLASDDYALAKARCEDLITNSHHKNWTILRPSITFSSRKYQLITMEANSFINRALENKITILPEIAMDKQATLTWAGDTGKMLSRLILNKKAYGEKYTVATAEHHTWREFSDYYKELIGMNYVTTDTETFLEIFDGGTLWARWRLMYDRVYDRICDNSKILRDTGLSQKDFMPIKEALKKELSSLPEDDSWCHYSVASIIYDQINRKMDSYVAELTAT